MTDRDQYIVMELAEAYRVLRNAFYENLGKPAPALSTLQERVQELIARMGSNER